MSFAGRVEAERDKRLGSCVVYSSHFPVAHHLVVMTFWGFPMRSQAVLVLLLGPLVTRASVINASFSVPTIFTSLQLVVLASRRSRRARLAVMLQDVKGVGNEAPCCCLL